MAGALTVRLPVMRAQLAMAARLAALLTTKLPLQTSPAPS